MSKNKPFMKNEQTSTPAPAKVEELDINQSTPQSATNQNVNAGEQINQMVGHNIDISQYLPSGLSNEELLSSIISIPDQELIPWGDCYLPSKGKYYGWANGIVRVKAMNQKAEKILTTQRYAASGESIEYLFRECCQFPDGFDPVDLILGDRVFLLFFLRGITHGNIYEFILTCANQACGSVNTYSYDLNSLASTIKYADDSLGNEPFKVSLPYLSKVTGRDFYVRIRFLRTRDSYDMLKRQSFNKKAVARPGARTRGQEHQNNGFNSIQQLDETITDSLERVIVDVMGVTDRLSIKDFVQRMHALDTATIREWLKDNTPSMDSSIIVTCPQCSHEFTAELPISETFFRPSKSR